MAIAKLIELDQHNRIPALTVKECIAATVRDNLDFTENSYEGQPSYDRGYVHVYKVITRGNTKSISESIVEKVASKLHLKASQYGHVTLLNIYSKHEMLPNGSGLGTHYVAYAIA